MIKRKHTRCVVFHHALAESCTIEEIRRWHLTRGFEAVGYHFFVDKLGVIHKGRDVAYVGAHALGRNGDSVGVCLEGDFRHRKPSQKQIQGCVRLYHDLCRSYGKRLKIRFHRPAWYPNACPGKLLDRASFCWELGQGAPDFP